MPVSPTVERVLVLEDHAFQREVAVALLRACGVEQVWTAESGEALAIARRESVQVLICDLQTPGMDGVELIRHVAEEGVVHAVIVASGMDPALIGTVEAMARTYSLQVLGAIEKPLTRRNLDAMLADYRPPSETTPQRALEPVSLPEVVTALARNELFPHFQPKVSLATRECVGVEALIRWQHPTRGLVPPMAFIPVAEKTALIHDITWMMLEKAITGVQTWGRRAWPFSVSVNFSPHVLGVVGVVERIAALATRCQLEPENIVCEVTESVLANNTSQLLETLARLRLKGFGLSIDDFGTGYSSMQQLSRVSFTELKIDRTFVHGASTRRHLRTILESSLDLARKLKLTSVAEGVETDEDWNLLRELGCDVAQGYYIAKPMAADRFWDWHERWTQNGEGE